MVIMARFLDVLIIGAGPAGFSASLAAMEHKLNCVTLEQETLGGTVCPLSEKQNRYDTTG